MHFYFLDPKIANDFATRENPVEEYYLIQARIKSVFQEPETTEYCLLAKGFDQE